MPNSESDRALQLNNQLRKAGLSPDNFIEAGYTGVVLHSASTLFAGNQGVAEITGYSLEEIVGLNAWRLFPPASIPIVKERLTHLSEEPYQVLIQKKDGKQLMVELKGKNIDIAHEQFRAIQVKLVP